jgi:hypothetical protein
MGVNRYSHVINRLFVIFAVEQTQLKLEQTGRRHPVNQAVLRNEKQAS